VDRLVDAIGTWKALEALGLDVFLRTILDPRTRYIVELSIDGRRAKLESGGQAVLVFILRAGGLLPLQQARAVHAYATPDWPIAILCDLSGRADVRQQGQCDCLLSQKFMESHASSFR